MPHVAGVATVTVPRFFSRLPANRRAYSCAVQYRCERHRGEGEICAKDGLVKLDGVGGAIILLRASLHREGTYFPPFPFNHSIETEGLAKMAIENGNQPYGMPMLKIWHK